jgi:hypothetical protein
VIQIGPGAPVSAIVRLVTANSSKANLGLTVSVYRNSVRFAGYANTDHRPERSRFSDVLTG